MTITEVGRLFVAGHQHFLDCADIVRVKVQYFYDCPTVMALRM